MNENYTDFRFPVIKANPWTKVFSPFTPADAISLISHLLTYTPTQRYGPFDAMAHEVNIVSCFASFLYCPCFCFPVF
jgi:serine/threonine protein kinase